MDGLASRGCRSTTAMSLRRDRPEDIAEWSVRSEHGGDGDAIGALGSAVTWRTGWCPSLLTSHATNEQQCRSGGGERLELVADARLGLVTDLEPMTAASSAGTALHGQRLPPPHARRPVVRAQRAGEGQ